MRTSVEFKGLKAEDIYVKGHFIDEINNICPSNGKGIELLIVIASMRGNTLSRTAIRETWGNLDKRTDVSKAFILGDGPEQQLSVALSDEYYEYGDIIQGHFIDFYQNLTLKTISYLEWVDTFCSQAKYVLKTDDDVFINVHRLMTFLNKRKKKRVIYGRVYKNLSKPSYPWFCTGPAYVMTGDIIHDLYVQALKTNYLPNEDVFITGIVANSLGIKRIHANDFYNRLIPFGTCFIHKAISVHSIDYTQQYKLWGVLRKNSICKFYSNKLL